MNLATIGTDAAFSAIAETRSELLRWLLSGVVILMAYAAMATVLIHFHEFDEPDDPASALVIELAPMPVAPTNMPSDVQPEPEREEVPPEKPVEKLEEPELKPDDIPDVKPEIVIPQPMPETEPTPREEPPPPPPPSRCRKSARRQLLQRHRRADSAPASRTLVPAWKRQVVNLLERNKRYPRQRDNAANVGSPRFPSVWIGRDGFVVEPHRPQFWLFRSRSGDARTCQPRATLPGAAVRNGGIELTVPIRFMMN